MADGADQTQPSGDPGTLLLPPVPSAYGSSPQAADGVLATSKPDTPVPNNPAPDTTNNTDNADSSGDAGSTPAPQEQTAYPSPQAAGAPVPASTPSSSTGAVPANSGGTDSADTQAASPDDGTNDLIRGRAAFICGALVHLGPRPQSDAELADFFNVPAYVIAANPTGFQRRYTIIDSLKTMEGCPALTESIAQNPGIARYLGSQIADHARTERALNSPDIWDYGGEALKGFGEIGNDLLFAGTVLSAAPLVLFDKLASAATGKQYTSAEDAMFGISKHFDDNRRYFETDPNTGVAGKVMHAGGNFVGMLPYIVLTGGEGLASSSWLARLIAGARGMAVPATVSGVNTANDVYGVTASSTKAVESGGMSAATTVLQGTIPISLPGSILTRLLTGTATGVVSSEGSRRLNNAVLPESMQQKFDPENVAANAFMSGLLSLIGAHMQSLKAADDLHKLEIINKTSGNSALRAGNPQAFRQLVARMAKGSDLKTLYIDPQTLMQVMAKHGVSMSDLNAVMPDMATQLQEAIRNKGYVSFPVDEFATHLAGSAFSADLLPHFKTDPKGMTYAEGQAHIAEQDAKVTARVEKLANDDTARQAWDQSRQAVHDDILNRLNASGKYTPQQAEAGAALQSEAYSAMALNMGVNPEEAYRQFTAPEASADIAATPEGDATVSANQGEPSKQYQQQLQNIVDHAESIQVGSQDNAVYPHLFEAIGKNQAFTISKTDLGLALKNGNVSMEAFRERLPGLYSQFENSTPAGRISISHELLALHPEVLKFTIPYAIKSGSLATAAKPDALAGNTQSNPASPPAGELPESTPGPGVPVHGFDDAAHYRKFVTTLQNGLADAGYPDAVPIMQGSSVTSKSYRSRRPFGPHSDLDVAIASPTLFAKAKALGLEAKQEVRAGPINSKKMLQRLGLWRLKESLSGIAKREVAFMLYKDEQTTWRRGPSTHIK